MMDVVDPAIRIPIEPKLMASAQHDANWPYPNDFRLVSELDTAVARRLGSIAGPPHLDHGSNHQTPVEPVSPPIAGILEAGKPIDSSQ